MANDSVDKFRSAVTSLIGYAQQNSDEQTEFQARVNDLNFTIKIKDVDGACTQFAMLVDRLTSVEDPPPYVRRTLTWAQDQINDLLLPGSSLESEKEAEAYPSAPTPSPDSNEPASPIPATPDPPIPNPEAREESY